jgi:hypothetical protein
MEYQIFLIMVYKPKAANNLLFSNGSFSTCDMCLKKAFGMRVIEETGTS